LIAFAGLASVEAHGENAQERHQQRAAEGQRQTGRHEAAARYDHRSRPTAPAHPVATHYQRTPVRGTAARRPAEANTVHETHLAGGARVREVSRSSAGGQVRVVRYGNTVSGTVERTIRPGVLSRTFVSGGHVLYTHVYQRHVWYQSGRAFTYETFVPAVRFPAPYYAWALTAWPRPVSYAWGWQVQPWYPSYGFLFTPYPVYTSPDLWMTDYIIAQSMQTAYQAQTPAPAPQPSPEGAGSALTIGASDATSVAPTSDAAAAPPPGEAPLAPQSSDAPAAPVGLPPAITPQVKAQLNTQIKVQLQEQQAAAAMPVSLTTQSSPPALRPNHVFFQVVQPLDVPSGTANGYCSLSPDDYIKRTGGMSNDDWMVPVVVELSRPSDCPQGLQTRIGLNDLNAMENEQEARVMEAMQAASKSMGPHGPPSGPGTHPTLIADGSTLPDPGALEAIRAVQ
jgi:hypothetical protein